MAELTFYTNPLSRGRIVRWMLEETGAPYESVAVGYGPEMNTPEYLALNPMGKVPTVVHRGTVVTECAAICAYLADALPEAGLAPPADSADRAAYYRWMFFGAGPVEAAVTNATFGWLAEGPEQQGRVGYGSLDRVADTLQTLLSDRDWVLGDRFSAADVYLGAQVVWGLQFGTLPERPGFRAYADRLMARPAAIRAQGIDDALLAQAQGGG